MNKTPPAANRWFWFAAKFAVSIALLVWLFRRFELNLSSLAPVSYYPLLVALAATFVTIVAAAGRWQVILRMYSHLLPFRETLRIHYVAVFLAQFLPGFVGGDAVRVYMAMKRGMRLATGIASVMLDRAVTVLGLILVVAVVAPRAVEVVTNKELKLLLLGIAVFACAGTALLMVLSGPLNQYAKKLHWILPFALLASGLRDIFSNIRALASVLAISALNNAMYAVALWLALAAFGKAPDLLDVVAVFAPVILFQMLPVSIGGWGVRELMAVTMLAGVGVPGPQALSASIVLGIVQMVACLPGSAAWFIRVNVAHRPDMSGG